VRRLLGGAVALVVAGCGLVPARLAQPGGAVPYPEGCDDFGLSARRCAFIVETAADELGVNLGTVASVELYPDDCRLPDCARTTSWIVGVRFVDEGGRSAEQATACSIDAPYSLLCTDDPEIRISTVLDGYHDIPCGPTGNECATPVPTVDPGAATAAEPLRVTSLDIPIDRLGAYRVEVGTASLANGVVREASFELVDRSPSNLHVSPAGIRLAVDSDVAGRPLFVNAYEHGWWDGVEPVSVWLEFHVLLFEPGAILQIRDLRLG